MFMIVYRTFSILKESMQCTDKRNSTKGAFLKATAVIGGLSSQFSQNFKNWSKGMQCAVQGYMVTSKLKVGTH